MVDLMSLDPSSQNLSIENGHLPSLPRVRAQADLEGKSVHPVSSCGSVGPDPFLTGLGSFATLAAIRTPHRTPQI
jgi:hypothetical protein